MVDLPRPGPRHTSSLKRLPRDTRRSAQRRGRGKLADAFNQEVFPTAWEQSVIEIVQGGGSSGGSGGTGIAFKAAILTKSGVIGAGGVAEQVSWDSVEDNGGSDWYDFTDPQYLEVLESGMYLVIATARPEGSADDDFTMTIAQSLIPAGTPVVGAIAHGSQSNATAVALMFIDVNVAGTAKINLTGVCDGTGLNVVTMYVVKLGALS